MFCKGCQSSLCCCRQWWQTREEIENLLSCNRIRSGGGGGKGLPWGGGSSHEDLFCLHISTIPWEPGSVFIWTPIVVNSGVRFPSITCTPTDVFFSGTQVDKVILALNCWQSRIYHSNCPLLFLAVKIFSQFIYDSFYQNSTSATQSCPFQFKKK